jgi:ubiquitin carboxyl-terminal hydrolase 5/13
MVFLEFAPSSGVDPTTDFQFQTQTRLQCAECQRVRYTDTPASDVTLQIPIDEALLAPRADADGKALPPPALPPVSFAACLQRFAAAQALDAYQCAHCQRRTSASQTTRFKRFPRTLIVHMARFVQPNWVPVKLNVAIDAPDAIDLEALRSSGLQAGELAMPGDDASARADQQKQAAPVANAEHVATLSSMGFSVEACTRAVRAVASAGVEQASAWLFSHLDDADLNDPLPDEAAPAAATSASSSAPACDPAAVEQLASMGFDDARVRHALQETRGDVDRALDWLFSHADDPLPLAGAVAVAGADAAAGGAAAGGAVDEAAPGRYALAAFITHLGTSTGCGHYVAHSRQADGSWAYFNDAKVSASGDAQKEQAYIYLYRRVD